VNISVAERRLVALEQEYQIRKFSEIKEVFIVNKAKNLKPKAIDQIFGRYCIWCSGGGTNLQPFDRILTENSKYFGSLLHPFDCG